MSPTDGEARSTILGHSWFVYLFLAFCTCLAILLRGYAYGKEDQNLYLPFILHWNNPSLFPHDYLLTLGFARESVVWGLLAQAGRWISLPVILAVLWVAVSYLVLLFTYKIGLAWWGRPETAWVAVFLWIPTYVVPGVANATFDDYFTTRIFGALLGLVALYFNFKGRNGSSAIAIFVGFLLHVVSVLPLAVALGLVHLARRRWRALAMVMVACVGAALALTAYSAHFGSRHNLFAVYSGTWLEMVRHADFELFPQQWSRNAWISLAIYVAAYYLLFRVRKMRGELTGPEKDACVINTGIVICSAIGLAGALNGTALLVQLCLFRGYLFFMFLLAISLAGPIAELLQSNRWISVAVGCWIALAWVTDNWIIQAAAVLLLLAHPTFNKASYVWALVSAWLTKKKERSFGALLIILLCVLVWENSHFTPGWSLGVWRSDQKAFIGTLLAAWMLLGLRALAPRIWEGFAPVLFPVCLVALILISPNRVMVEAFRGSAWFRHLYGSAIATQVVQAGVDDIPVAERKGLAQLVKKYVPINATLIVPPDWMSFRLDTLRSPFVTIKDKAPVEFGEDYSRLWLGRIQEIHALRQANGQWCWDNSLSLSRLEVLALAERYLDINLNYIITQAVYDFPVVGKSGGWILYRISGSPSLEGPK